ncbi:MAG: HEAT repeat domain-containing protein, partial [bacterium]
MNLKARIFKLLSLRREESKPVFLLMTFSFFVGLTVSFYFTASNAIFLKHFKPGMISLSYIISGAVVYFIWWLLSRLDKKLSIPKQVMGKLLFILLTVLAISIGVWLYDTAWLAFVMFTWVRVLSYVILVSFWGLAGNLFNIRQGKRIFGLIGIGEAVSIIIGYFSIPLFLQFMKAPDLLFLACFSLLLCLITVSVILRKFKNHLVTGRNAERQGQEKVTTEWNYWKLVRKPYFMLISLMALLPIFGYLFVNYLFLAQTKLEFANNPEIIARFFGIFLGFVSIVELIFKLFSGSFLNKYGIKASLLSLPIILIFSSLLAALFGTVYGTVGLFFAFIALARLFERSVRGAVYEPAFQLLYQPLPAEQRMPFQNQIEGIPKAMGTIITGAFLLALSAIPFFNLVHFDYFFLLVLGLWIWIAMKMYQEYRKQIRSKLTEMKLESKTASEKIVPFIEKTLSSAGDGEFEKLYNLFERVEPVRIESALEGTYRNAPGPVRKILLRKIRDRQYVPALDFIQPLTGEDPGEELSLMIERTNTTLRDAEDFPFEFLVRFARSEKAETRIKVARLLGYSGRYNTYKLLINLLNDPDPAVKKAAIISSGKIRRYELWPFLIENLVYPEFCNAAKVAVILVGEPILKDVDHFFEKIVDNKAARLRIIQVITIIGGENAIALLRTKISYPDKDIRYQVLLSLSSMEYRASPSEVPFIKQTIEEMVETMVWIMASLTDVGGSVESMNLQDSLIREMEEKKENIFLLLSLLYDAKTIQHIRENIESPDKNAKIYALEVCDMTVPEEVKELFLPLFEDISLSERMNRFSLRF